MGLLDTLRKLGILKVGAEKAIYTKAADRPDSFVDEDFALSEWKDAVAEKPAVNSTRK